MAGKDKKGYKVPERVEKQREEVVNAIVEAMREGEWNWMQGWVALSVPENAVSGKPYRGGNRFGLTIMAMVRGHKDPRWCTFKQAMSKGWKIKKGAESAVVEKWKMVSFTKEVENADGTKETRTVTFPKCVGYWSVFNAEDIEGIPERPKPERNDNSAAIEAAERFIATSRCKVVEDTDDLFYTDTACYVPRRDELYVPSRDAFYADESFLRTLLHEMVHSTCVPMGRDAKNWFGTPKYAFEELIAEIGAMFTAADVGFAFEAGKESDNEFFGNHVAYLQNWISVLEDDPAELFRAAAAASKAADYLVERYNNAKDDK